MDLYSLGLGFGLRPREFWDMTFMEFAAFARGETDRDRRKWEHTSSVMALFANANRDPKRRPQPFTPEDFSPYSENQSQVGHELTKEQQDQIAQWRVNPSSM